MILRLALRSLAVRPIRTIVLSFGFGLGVAVMAILLGVGEVILQQSQSPALQGGGDAVISGGFGSLDNARFVMSNVLGAGDLQPRIRTVSPSRRATVYLVTPRRTWSLVARAGVPSLEQAIDDPEVAGNAVWVDAAPDRTWSTPDSGDVLRAIDRFHPVPDLPEFGSSWAEWLYFNGRSADGATRFYLTFLVGSAVPASTRLRPAVVRLQLERAGQQTAYSASAQVAGDIVLASAPDLEIGDNRVRLNGQRYDIDLRLREEGARASTLIGHFTLDGAAGQSLPPAVMHGARGWVSGYVVPVLAGSLAGVLEAAGERLPLEGMTGYHDHNWGFWQDVRWQWGQVAHEGLAFVFGRVFPPPSVADPDRVPGFLGILGPDGPLGLSTDVTITEQDAHEQPQQVEVRARGTGIDVRLGLSVDRTVRTVFRAGGAAAGMDFLQLGGVYRVAGEAGGRRIAFSARGAAETFRRR